MFGYDSNVSKISASESLAYNNSPYISFKPSVKADFCAVRGDGTPLEVGTKVQVLEHAACLYSIQFIEGQKAPQYMIGMSKIRVVETGQEGWVFSPAVNKFNEPTE